ncbi:MAG TPA: hypothetical protein VD835_19945 [Pyrinomonadaceae bacterium]|nr:hypothetical protein [Pyrinomonadaceae bacterium]
MYKPNFCAECGGRVARVRWRVWTSRRFCAGCAGRFRRGRIAKPLVACVALLVAGYAAGRAMRPAPPPLVIERGALPPSTPPLASQLSTTQGRGTGATTEAHAHAYGADGTETERPTDPAEIVSICGARTQRGTPCSRRVRGTGRCWQHRGRGAMLPAAKLIVRE